jgi:xylan 1,4-beta-xylosidase
MIQNPVLPGFNPDPSFIRVEDDYYLATSTFEWYPGVQIHHSRDLVNWTLVSRPLNRKAQLDMRGNPDSCGIWAPCLSYADGKFWLVYTDVKRLEGSFKDAYNYIVTCDTIDGEWSDPIYVNASGFDPSLFHDDDGRKYFINMRWNHRGSGTGGNPKNDSFDGIILQEWDPVKGLMGPVVDLWQGTDLGLGEAPHLFKRNGYYYLTIAEGGTGYDHAVSLARSRSITGPYETHPDKHVLTARFNPESPLQRVGHGQYVEAADGSHWHSFLCGRPLPEGRYCPMGRETGLAKMEWRDDWLYLEGGGLVPPLTIPMPAEKKPDLPVVHDFTMAELPMDYQWLRTPEPERLFKLTGQALRMTGRESMGSWFEQALVARRQEHHHYRAECVVEADPQTWQQAAGLATYYNRHKFHMALVSHEEGRRMLVVCSCLGDWQTTKLTYHGRYDMPQSGPVTIGVEVRGASQQFTLNGAPVGPELDAKIITDEGGKGEHASFTGAFVGMFAHDVTGQGWTADFSRFGYWPG